MKVFTPRQLENLRYDPRLISVLRGCYCFNCGGVGE